jgi:DNA-directed RNA polymerase specialized sigma24 family protein
LVAAVNPRAWASIEAQLVLDARPLLIDLARNERQLFSNCCDLSLEDMVQQGGLWLVEAHRKPRSRFNPDRGSFSTWVNLIVRRRSMDMSKSRARSARREDIIRAEQSGYVEEPKDWETEDVVQWTANAYRQIRRNAQVYLAAVGATQGRGRPATYTPAQKMTLMALKAHRKLSVRGLEHLLRAREDLRRAMELTNSPCVWTLCYLEKSVRQIMPGLPASKN